MPDEARDPLAPDGADAVHSPDAWPPRPRPPADLRDRATALATRYGLSWARALVGVMVVVGVSLGGWWLLRPPAPPIEQSLPVASAETTEASSPVPGDASDGTAPPGGSTSTTAPSHVIAHAAGAVARPGVYRLPGSARVDDLVRAAGGLAAKADANRVNLAAPVTDGERVYIPALGETEPPVAVTPDGGGAAAGGSPADPGSGAAAGSGTAASSSPTPGGAPTGPVDLNTADLAALDTLPGVGPATAQAIITYRQEHGRFRSVDELLEVRGIGDAKMAELRDRVTVGG